MYDFYVFINFLNCQSFGAMDFQMEGRNLSGFIKIQ